MKFDDLNAKIRVYEQSLDQIIPPGNYIVARIDGRSFTRLTKEVCKFEAPFDKLFNQMMVETVRGMISDAGMGIIYSCTQNDEISLLFALESEAFGRKVRNLNSWCYWTLRREGKNATEASAELEGKSIARKTNFFFSGESTLMICPFGKKEVLVYTGATMRRSSITLLPTRTLLLSGAKSMPILKSQRTSCSLEIVCDLA